MRTLTKAEQAAAEELKRRYGSRVSLLEQPSGAIRVHVSTPTTTAFFGLTAVVK